MLELKQPARNRLFELGLGGAIALVAIVLHWKILRDGAPVNSHALTGHVVWLQHFAKQFAEGDLYPRWLAGTNYGYGSPTFVFYPPLIYYVGAILKVGGLNIDQVVAALLVLASLGSGLGFYCFGRSAWGKLPGFLGALTYMVNPYMVYNIYTRGTLSEIWALVWVPLGFWGTHQALKSAQWKLVPALALLLLALTHLPSLLLYIICWSFYLLCLFWLSRNKTILKIAVFALLGLGLAAFFLLPAIAEKSLVNVGSMGDTIGGFRANFVGTAMDYLYINPFMIDVQNIFIVSSLVAVALGAIALICFRRDALGIREVYCWIVFILLIAFLMSHWSAPIWQASKTLQALQFPWRLMGFYWFGIAALSSLAVKGIAQDFRLHLKVTGVIFFLGLTVFAGGDIYQKKSLSTLHRQGEVSLAAHEKMRLMGGEARERKLLQRIKIREENRLQDMGVIFYQPFSDNLLDVAEYRPLLQGDRRPVPLPQRGQPLATLVRGKAAMQVLQWRSNDRQITASVQERSRIRLRIYDFPAWQVQVDGVVYPRSQAQDGTMEIVLEPGFHQIQLYYRLTPAFKVGIGISLLSLLVCLLVWLKNW